MLRARDDVVSKVCTKCDIDKPINEYNWKKRGVLRRSECKACWSKYIRGHYHDNIEYYRKKAIRHMKNRRATARKWRLNYLIEHSCVDCGDDRIPCLDFDHVRGEKVKSISSMVSNGALVRKIVNEVQKCEVRCANCHRIRHARERGMDVPE